MEIDQVVGTLEDWDTDKRFGWIRRDSGGALRGDPLRRVFVHHSELRAGVRRGARVAFRIGVDAVGRARAIDVEPFTPPTYDEGDEA